jgi:phosphoserine phosphatase RsbU/P
MPAANKIKLQSFPLCPTMTARASHYSRSSAMPLLGFVKKRRSGNPAPAEVPELQDAELAAVYYDHRVGGDGYEFLRVSPLRVLFALFDVAGRIDENRPVVSAVQRVFRAMAPELFANEAANEADAMVELCLELNRTILNTSDHVCSTPAFAGCYNENLGTVSYFNAGHTPGLLADQSRIIELRATGLPLGLFSHATPDASIVALEPRDALVLVSRGVVEARRRGEEFGLEQVKHNLQNVSSETAPEICAGILDKLREFTGKRGAQNDVTVLALARHAQASAAAARANG